MRPRTLLRPIQAAWLGEIGVDLHWIEAPPAPDAEVRPAQAEARPAPTGRHPASAEAALPAASPGGSRSVPGAGIGGGQGPSGALRVKPPPTPTVPAIARPAAECSNLDELALAVRECRGCALHAQRARAVPGAGVTRQPAWFIVGEQPGIEDDASGRPFQGDQGRLLGAMLAAVHLPRADSIYYTHVVKCRAEGGHEPTAAAVAACLPYLHREIALVRPLRILALGRVAARAVLGATADLDELRGGPHAYRPDRGEPVPVWVTHQPSALLVRSADKVQAWRDLVALVQSVTVS